MDLRRDLGFAPPPPELERDVPLIDQRFLDAAVAELCRRSFKQFIVEFWPELEPNGRPFSDNRATDAIVQHLQAVGDGEIKKLGIACSPGIGKTTLTSVGFPAWVWARAPARRFICASHTHELAADTIAPKFLRVVQSDRYQRYYNIELTSDASKRVLNNQSGARYAIGVGGALTGLRGDIGLVDDSLNAIHAGNRDRVADVNNWFDQAFSTRFDQGPNAALIAIQQRLADHDLIWRFKEMGAEILELPARFEEGRRCRTSIWVDNRTKEGEILAPEIHSEEFLDEKLRVLRPHGFATQYQQRPTARGGEIFKVAYWRYFSICSPGEDAPAPRPRPEGAFKGAPHVVYRKNGRLDVDWVCLSVDPTGGSDKETASALGMATIMGKAERRFILHDHTPGPQTWGQTKKALQRAIIRTSDLTGWTSKILVLVEKKALGASAMDEIKDWIAEGLKNSAGRIIKARAEPYEPSGKGNKEARADFLEPEYFEPGLLYVLDGAEWVLAAPEGNDTTIIEEFASFPRGSRDDRVDLVSQCLDHYLDGAASAWVTLFGGQPADADEPEEPGAPAEPPPCEHQFIDGKCRICGH